MDLAEIFGYTPSPATDAALVVPVRSFLTAAAQEMALGEGNENVSALPGVSLSDLAARPDLAVISYPGLCALTETLVRKKGIAHALCAHLRAAASAGAGGSDKAKAGALRAYRNQLRAQSGKSLSAADAATLTTLSQQL